MPRSYSAFLIMLLSAGGWYFTKGPGQGQLGAIFQQVSQGKLGAPGQFGQYGQYGTQGGLAGGQYPPNNNYYGNGGGYPPYSNYPAQPSTPQIPASYASQTVPAQPPPPTPMFGGPAIRIASFNIQVFGEKKAQDQRVMATLGAIIRNFHVVAIQEIRTQDDYFIDNFLRTYVNVNGAAYDKVVGPRLGRSNSKEQYAYLYDTAAIEVNRSAVFTVNDPDDLLHREPLAAMFRVRGPPPEQAFTFILVNVHTDPDLAQAECNTLAQVYQVVRRASGGEDDIIMLGDFNIDDRHLGELGKLEGVKPVVRSTFTNTRHTEQFDNIVCHQSSTTEFTGRWGVFDFQQIYKVPPENAIQISDHLPVWAEFSAYESATPGRVARLNPNPRLQ